MELTEEQVVAIKKYDLKGIIDYMEGQILEIKNMVDNAKTSEELSKADYYFNYSIDECSRKLNKEEDTLKSL